MNETQPEPLGVIRRYLAIGLAYVCVVFAFHFALASQTPVGHLTGQVIIAETKQGLSDVTVHLTPNRASDDDKVSSPLQGDGQGEVQDSKLSRRRALTIRDGKFTINHIAAGKYFASVSTAAHEASQVEVEVKEGENANVTLSLTRSLPELRVAEHQRVFATNEKPFLPVRGYVDGEKTTKKATDSLHIRVYKTHLSTVLRDEKAAEALQSTGNTYDENPLGLSPLLLHPTATEKPKLLYERDLPIREADREGFFHKRIPLDEKGVGLYLVDVTHGKKAASAWILETNTALVTKRAKTQLLTYTADLQSGKAVPATTIRIYKGGSVIAAGTADNQGIATLTVPKSEGRLTTVAVRGDDEAVMGRNEYDSEERGDFVVHSYTDRTIYRPGQSISFKGIVRGKSSDGAQRYTVPANEPVTVEVRTPGGDRLLQEARTTNRYGSFAGSLTLSPEAPTGSYTLITTVRGEKHTSDITVAAYRKPEFEVKVTPAQKRYVRGETVEMTIDSKFYFGAPVAGAKVRYDVYRDTDWSAESDDSGSDDGDDNDTIKTFSGYENSYGDSVVQGETTLDENGKAVIRFAADVNRKKNDSENDYSQENSVATDDEKDIPQEQLFTLHATVIDQSKREVEGQGVAHVSAGDFRLTLRPEGYVATPGKPTAIIITARDHDNKPVPNTLVTLQAYYSHLDKKTKTQVQNTIVTLRGTTGVDGRVFLSITPPHGGELNLIAQATDSKNRTIYTRGFLWATGNEGGTLQTEYGDLALLTDKQRYAPGDTARVLINTSRIGQTVLVTVEGERVYTHYTVPITQNSTVLRVPVRPEYGPNVSLNACYIRNKKFATGTTPLRVTIAERTVNVKIESDKSKYEPGDMITYHLLTTDPKNRPVPCELSFGVVDESIYALREDNPKALKNAFYPHRTNNVQTSYSFAIEYLGDADKAEPDIQARTKFLDTAYWNPSVETDVHGKATLRFRLPDNLTTWRATANVCTLETAIGHETNKVLVNKPFFVRVETPRFVTQQDTTRLLALVHNETGADQSARVRLTINGLTVSGLDTKFLSVKAGAVGQAEWNIAADTAHLGAAKIRVTAWVPQRSPEGRQYTDGVETNLPLRPHGRDRFTNTAGVIDQSATQKSETFGVDTAAVPGLNRMRVRITPSVGGALTGGLEYVIGYPYGCTEQTLSRFVPDLLVEGLQRKTNTELAPKQTAQLPKMVRDGLSRLYRFQHSDGGGWGWWENDKSDPFMTAYALYGLSVAKEQGYAINPNVLKNGRDAAFKLIDAMDKANSGKTKTADTINNDIRDKPFLLYALALSGDSESARHGRSNLSLSKMPVDALAYLVLLDKKLGGNGGAAYALLGTKAVSDSGMLHWQNAPDRWNSSDRIATALVLRALLAVNPQDNRVPRILRWLMTNRTDGYWGDTRDTAWVVGALCDYLALHPADAAPTGTVTMKVNGRDINTFNLNDPKTRSSEIIVDVPTDAIHAGANSVALTRTGGKSSIYYAVTLRQTVVYPVLPAVPDQGVIIKREYLRVLPRRNGQSWQLDTEPTNDQFHQGDQLHVKLTIITPRDMGYVLIEDAFPAGCEVTERGTEEETVDWNYWYSSVDVRDDRVAFFARTLPKGKHVVEYNLRAQTEGQYHALPTLLQTMYSNVRAESAEESVAVK